MHDAQFGQIHVMEGEAKKVSSPFSVECLNGDHCSKQPNMQCGETSNTCECKPGFPFKKSNTGDLSEGCGKK